MNLAYLTLEHRRMTSHGRTTNGNVLLCSLAHLKASGKCDCRPFLRVMLHVRVEENPLTLQQQQTHFSTFFPTCV